jgi:Lambda phage tail tape-measure protein (Tape_meas_lam_C)
MPVRGALQQLRNEGLVRTVPHTRTFVFTMSAFANAFSGAEDALVGVISSGKLEFRSLADSILSDLARMTVRQTITAPLAGALQSAFAGGGSFGLFHEGGVAGDRPAAVRYADASVFEHAPRYHGGGFAGAGLLPDGVPIIAQRGELVVPPERVVREEKTAREQRPITVVVNVTAADASSFRASHPRERASGCIVGTYHKDAGTNNQRVYLNGIRIAQMRDNQPIHLNSAALGIRRHVSGIADPFNGHIDEFRFAHVSRWRRGQVRPEAA